MSKFSTALVRLRKQAGLSQKALAEQLGVSRSAIGMYERGDREPSFEQLEAMARLFHVSLGTLMGEAPPPEGALPYREPYLAPILGTIPAGHPVLAVENIEGYTTIPWRDAENYFFLRVRGDSMRNAGISSGDLVLLRKQDWAENGDIVAARLNDDEATLKRYKEQGDTVLLLPENPDYDPRMVPKSAFREGSASILGVAVEIRKKL